MSLQNRARRIAGAGKGEELIGLVQLVSGAAIAAVGLQTYSTALIIVGTAIAAMRLGSLLNGVDRAYLEGFSDGIAAEAELTAAAERRPGPAAHVRGLQGSPERDVGGATDGAPDGDQQPARGTGPFAGADGGFADIAGLDRPARAAFDPDGAPTLRGSGPRQGAFPVIPAAQPSGAPVSIRKGRAADRK